MNSSPPGFSVQGIPQARILEWIASPFSRGSSRPRIPGLLHRRQILYHLSYREVLCKRSQFNSWVRKICWRRDRLPTPVFLGFPCGSAGKESICKEGDLGLIPGLGRSPGEGKGCPSQYSGLENSMDCMDYELTKTQT